MAGYDWTHANTNLLKVVYDNEDMRSLVAEHVKIDEKFGKFKGNMPSPGSYTEFAVMEQWPASVGAMPKDGSTRTAAEGTTAKGRFTMRQYNGTFTVGHAAMLSSKSDPQAYADSLEFAKKGLVLRIKDHKVKQLLGGNSGILARLSAAEADGQTVLSVYGMLNYTKGNGTYLDEGAEVFKVGDTIVLDPAATDSAGIARVVSAVDPSAGTITISVALAGTTGGTLDKDIPIVYGESALINDYGNSADGLNDLFDASGTYENLAPGSHPLWVPKVYTGAVPGTEESLSSRHMNRIIYGSQVASNGKIDLICMPLNMIQDFSEMFEDQIQYDPQTLKGGVSHIEWKTPQGGVQVFFDSQFPHHTIIGLDTSEMFRGVLDEGGFLDQDGNMLKWVAGTTTYTAVWSSMWNIGTRMRNAHVIQKDIDEVLTF